jgi:hypothetical protein
MSFLKLHSPQVLIVEGTRTARLSATSLREPFARGFFEKIVDVLVGRGLHPGLGLDPLRDLDRGIQADRSVQLPPAAEVSFDQDEFVRGDLAETRSGRAPFSRGVPRGAHFLGRLFVDNYRACDEVAEPATLAVAHHADEGDSVDSGQAVNCPHQVSSNRFKRVNWPAGFFDDSDPSISLSRRLALPNDLKDGEVSPINCETDKNRQGRADQPGKEREDRINGKGKDNDKTHYEI